MPTFRTYCGEELKIVQEIRSSGETPWTKDYGIGSLSKSAQTYSISAYNELNRLIQFCFKDIICFIFG